MEPAPSRHLLRWIIPVAYVAVMDGFALFTGLSVAFDPESAGMFDAAFSFLGVAAPFVLVANFVEFIVVHVRKVEDRRSFQRQVMLLFKLGLIPFFCLGGIYMVLFSLLLLHPVLMAAGILFVPTAAALGWLVMMGGSLWAFAYVLGLRRGNLLYTSECVAHFILQLVFFLDVADAIGLFVRGRKLEAQAAATRAPGYPGQAPVSWR